MVFFNIVFNDLFKNVVFSVFIDLGFVRIEVFIFKGGIFLFLDK